MRFVVVLVGLAGLLAGVAGAQEAGITHGPILGRLSEDGVGVWARTARPGGFRVRYGTRAEQLNQRSEQAETSLAVPGCVIFAGPATIAMTSPATSFSTRSTVWSR